MDLRTRVRSIAKALDEVGPSNIDELVAPLREQVQPNVHVGRKDLSPEETVEWYAGQLLDLVDTRAWFGINSWMNCVDKFAPKVTSPLASEEPKP